MSRYLAKERSTMNSFPQSGAGKRQDWNWRTLAARKKSAGLKGATPCPWRCAIKDFVISGNAQGPETWDVLPSAPLCRQWSFCIDLSAGKPQHPVWKGRTETFPRILVQSPGRCLFLFVMIWVYPDPDMYSRWLHEIICLQTWHGWKHFTEAVVGSPLKKKDGLIIMVLNGSTIHGK